ncbi:adenylosuccinate synthetase [Mesorhizobium sp. M0184]|uniref:adenylosuccinate synthetase n=1 Tax=Mesorhizobium sp. M0184 TaxID=2956906 RepID=UPI00333CD051
MPVTVVVGGQYGSEGKGKVSAYVAKSTGAAAVVRVGGPNSGHSAVSDQGELITLRQLPAGAVSSDALMVLPAGSLIDLQILQSEIARLKVRPDRLRIDGNASIIGREHIDKEADLALMRSIGSTASGTGAALIERLSRTSKHRLARDVIELQSFIEEDSAAYLRSLLDRNARVVIEGTQGFGLSIWHSHDFPYATSRDTTASGFVSEAGLAPHDVDDVVLVLRTFPIRVGGNSGPLPNEIAWPELAKEAQLATDFVELTSATHRVRRVGRFDPDIVKRAINSNRPHRVVMNHMDYIDPKGAREGPTWRSQKFLAQVEQEIGRRIDLLGFGPASLEPRSAANLRHAG